MSDNAIDLPSESVHVLLPSDVGADTSLFVVTANGVDGMSTEVIDLRKEAPDAFPPRTVADRVVTDQASFATELGRRPLIDHRSTVWGNRERGTITAIYDELDDNAELDYTRRADRLILQFVKDPDWATMLTAADGKPHGQEEFGDLIESAGHLITSHPAAELMEIVDSIRASSSGSFQSRIKRDTGSQHLTYSEEVNASAGKSGDLEVPREITLTARPYEGWPAIEIACWLRLRVFGGSLTLSLVPKPYQHLVRDAWTVVTTEVSETIGVPVYAANTGR